ncbi:MAG: hypothetical protein HYU88_06875 [Chloroflexi bacterium]|nr:hypothetical protein [Chloroflexota bacterium]
METAQRQSVLARLGMRPLVNAHSRLTRLGGSIMAQPVLEAMLEASRHFYDMFELQERVGERIAALTQNEAAYVTSGAAAGLVLATAACITGADPARIAKLPQLDGLKDEVVVHRFQRNHYDNNVRTPGTRLVEIGGHRQTHRWELEEAIGPRTAAVLYFTGPYVARNLLPLEVVIEVASARDVPVIVDAAAHIPPASNLWRFTQMGAALAIFSGGKGLGGPQSSGLILGRRDLIAACKLLGSPSYAIGRPMKVGKEEMVGLLAAVELYLDGGEQAQRERCEAWARLMLDALAGTPGLSARRFFPNTHTQPLPEVLVELDEARLGLTRDEIVRRLAAGDPRIEVAPHADAGLLLNPDTLQDGEAELVAQRLKAVLAE